MEWWIASPTIQQNQCPPTRPLADGQRGSGLHAGQPGTALFPPLTRRYPSCSRHGAMNALGGGKWRCLAPGCNCGLEEITDGT